MSALFFIPYFRGQQQLSLIIYAIQYAVLVFLYAVRAKNDTGNVRIGWLLLATTVSLAVISNVTTIFGDPTVGYPPETSLPIFFFLTTSLIFLSWDGILSVSRTRVILETLWLSTLFLMVAWHPLIQPFSQLQTASFSDQISFALLPVSGLLTIALCLAVVNQSSSKEFLSFSVAAITAAVTCIGSMAEIWNQEVGGTKYFEGYDYIWHFGVFCAGVLSQVSFDWKTKKATNVRTYDSRMLLYASLVIGFGIMAFTVPTELLAFLGGFGFLILLMASNIGAVNKENRQLTSELRDLALKDYLTGLPNRRSLMEYLDFRESKQYGILFIDLDYFKEVNDTYGHEAGDRVLKEMAERLRNNLRDNDFVARLGGDEFVVVLNDATKKQTFAVAQKLQSVIHKEFELFNGSAKIGITVGVYAGKGLAASDMLDKADQAMLLGKRRRQHSDEASKPLEIV